MTPPGRDGEPPDADLPTSLVPRWLALLVLMALLASAGFSVCQVLGSGGSGSGAPEVARPPPEAPPAP